MCVCVCVCVCACVCVCVCVCVCRLLDTFFDKVDPTTKNRQGNDSGTQYRSGIFYHSDAQKQAAEKKIQEVNDKLAKGEKVRHGHTHTHSHTHTRVHKTHTHTRVHKTHAHTHTRAGTCFLPHSLTWARIQTHVDSLN